MGVTGLWRLIEPVGKPVPVETLENKILAVDISIWLHQMVKGYQDAKGAPLPNAHLMGLFQRLCKLLYFRIKPVFVFDGAFPDLKKETIAKRQNNKAKYNSQSERLKRELAILLSKKTAISNLLGKHISPKKSNNAGPSDNDDIFKLPALPPNEESESDSEDEQTSSGSIVDLHSVDIDSDNFKNLPVKEKYDLLVELKDTRKMNSWGKLHELPKQSDNFSDFQMQRLLKRRKVQECLEETEKEMGDSGMSLIELESLLNEEGIDTKIDSLPTRRIASNESTRFLLINDVKKALAEAKKKKETSNQAIQEENTPASSKKDEVEDDLEKAIKMSLECVNEPDTSAGTSKTDDSWTSCLTDTDYSDSDEESFDQPDMTCAKAYIMQYSDFTKTAIDDIVTGRKNTNKNKDPKIPHVDIILNEINQEKSFIVDNIHILSDDCAENDTNFKTTKFKEQNVIELDSSVETILSPAKCVDMYATEPSVICLENSAEDIVTVDSSTEDNEKEDMYNEIESGTSNDEFEDVPEIGTKQNKTVVQLILNTNDIPEDDDMFADVFEDKKGIDNKNKNSDMKIVKSTIDRAMNTLDPPLKLIECSDDVTAENVNSRPTNTSIKMSDSLKEIQQDELVKQKLDAIKPNENINKGNIQKLPSIDSKNETDSLIPKPVKNNSQEISKPINKPHIDPITTEKLNSLVDEIQNEEQDLLQEKGRLDRVGRNITEQMTKEAQELLQIFGIPYIVAPMEAEAQCAFLETVNLTDGTITDDSDIWLFGGRTVYKNFFNQKKHVLQFLADRIEKSFHLNREQLVLLALLVGSDYTTGVPGVGPVTALEILASFPFNKKQLLNESSNQARYKYVVAGLQEFKHWVRAGKRTDNITLKKKLKNVSFTEDFPSVRVVQAYLEPNVEKSEGKFTWGELDLTILRDYTKAKFGWSQNKLDEIIKPVLSRRLERKSQKSVQDYFKRKIEFQPLDDQMSKRVKAAVQKMDPSLEIPSEEHNVNEERTKPSRKRKVIKSKTISDDPNKVGSSLSKQRKNEEIELHDHVVKVVSQIDDNKSSLEIVIPKSDRVQEIIPQREKDKQNLLQNKLKAIEVFRKTKIDRKKKVFKKKTLQPKEKAELSESSDSD